MKYKNRCSGEENKYKVINEQGETLEEFITKYAAKRYAEENSLWFGELKVQMLD